MGERQARVGQGVQRRREKWGTKRAGETEGVSLVDVTATLSDLVPRLRDGLCQHCCRVAATVRCSNWPLVPAVLASLATAEDWRGVVATARRSVPVSNGTTYIRRRCGVVCVTLSANCAKVLALACKPRQRVLHAVPPLVVRLRHVAPGQAHSLEPQRGAAVRVA